MNKKLIHFSLILISFLFFTTHNIIAQTEIASGAYNGHKYSVVSFPAQSWDAANAQIAGLCDAHLAVITDGGENDFVVSLLESNVEDIQQFWLGGFQANPNAPAGDTWTWVTGETWDYTNWGTGEPNDFAGSGSESFLAIWNLAAYSGWAWNDEGNFENIAGYIVESGLDAIDIKPGSDPNSINCGNANGVITVALLSSDCFDATTVDHTTVTFEGASETHVNKKTGEARRHEEDVDGDGDTDLVFHFRAGETSLDCGSTSGALQGYTYDGNLVYGQDDVNMVEGSLKKDGSDSDNLISSLEYDYKLIGNYPNPFNPETHINYSIPESGTVTLTVYNLLGVKVKTLYQGHSNAGVHSILWNATDDSGSRVPSGIYFVLFQANQFSEIRKMTLLK
jgi:hypothetical protein